MGVNMENLEVKRDLKSIKETAGILGVAYNTLYHAIKREEIPFYRIGRAYRLDPGEVLQALKQGKKE
jgi:excisionase family DNA binding protein